MYQIFLAVDEDRDPLFKTHGKVIIFCNIASKCILVLIIDVILNDAVLCF